MLSISEQSEWLVQRFLISFIPSQVVAEAFNLKGCFIAVKPAIGSV
jgi:hypothetical protein